MRMKKTRKFLAAILLLAMCTVYITPNAAAVHPSNVLCEGSHEYTINRETHSREACDICGLNEINGESHTYSENENHIYACTACGAEPSCHGQHEYIKSAYGHQLSACDKCGYEGGDIEEHKNSDCRDKLCDICSFELAAPHINENNDGVCDRCGIKTQDFGAYILDGKYIYGITDPDINTVTSLTDDGYLLTRPSGKNGNDYWIRSSLDVKESNGVPIDVSQAEYIIVKYKVSAKDEDYRLIMSTTGASSVNTSNDFTGYTSLKLGASADTAGKWIYQVIHGPTALQNYKGESIYIKDGETDSYIIDTFYVQSTNAKSSALTIGAIAFADDMAEVEAFLGKETNVTVIQSVKVTKTTIANGSNPWGYAAVSEQVTNGKIQHNYSTTLYVDANGNERCYTICSTCGCAVRESHINDDNDLWCDRCGVAVEDINVSFLTGKDIYAITNPDINTKTSLTDEGYVLTRPSGKNGNDYWIRSGLDVKDSNGAPINVGQAEYIIIKYKVSAKGADYRLMISTTGASSVNTSNDFTGYSSLKLGATTSAANAGEWIYQVIQAPTAFQNYKGESVYVKDGATDSYIIDTFYVQSTNTNSSALTIAYIAFAEDMTDVEKFVGKDADIKSIEAVTVTKTSAASNSNPTGYNAVTESVADGKIQHGSIDTVRSADEKRNTVYSAVCLNCGYTLSEKVVSSYVNSYLDAGTLNTGSAYQATAAQKIEDGEAYYHLAGQGKSAQHIWLRENYYSNSSHTATSGGGSKLSENINIGMSKYMVVKLRTNDIGESVKFMISTRGWNFDTDGAVGFGKDSVTKTVSCKIADGESGEWKTFLIDLAVLGSRYALDENGEYVIDTFCLMQDSLTANEYIDIAYVAFVNSIEEAMALTACEGKVTTISANEIAGSADAPDMKDNVTEDTVLELEEEAGFDIKAGYYSNGTGLIAAGAGWKSGTFASSFTKIDESKAVTKTAEEMLALLSKKNGAKLGEVYRVSETLILASNKTYYGNFAAIIAEGGVVIENASDISVRELIIKGDVTINNSAEIELYKVEIKGVDKGVSIEGNSSDIIISSCAIKASDTAIYSVSNKVSVYQSRLVASKGIISEGSDMTVQDSIINAVTLGISSSGRYFIARSNTITVSDVNNGIGIDMLSGSYNSMAALNAIDYVQSSIRIQSSYNCEVILNQAISIDAIDNTHLYVIKNRLGGKMVLKGNTYLIADGNSFITDGKRHLVINSGNTSYNGDNIQDINGRIEYGADENLLPHTDTEQYTNMEMRESITDLSSIATQSYSAYVMNEAMHNGIVIVPPGLYSLSDAIDFGFAQKDTAFYSYGAKVMATYSVGNVLKAEKTENVSVNGFTAGFIRPSCGQVHVLAVDAANKKLTVTVSAGFVDGFHMLAPTDPDDCGYNPTFLSLYHQNADGSEISAAAPYGGHGNIQAITDNKDGTYTVTMSKVDGIVKGDMMVTRLGERGQKTIYTANSSNIQYKDLTVYAISNAQTNHVTLSRDVSFERYHSAKTRGYEITESVYNSYKALEEQYGVSLGIYYDDEFDMYRGPDPIWCVGGSMEVNACYTGTKVISSIMESSCDDGSNQRGTSSRIAGMVKNTDGTYTVYYKGNLNSTHRWSTLNSNTSGKAAVNNEVTPLEVGNTIVAYTSDGRVLINDAVVLTEPVAGSPSDLHLAHTVTTEKTCDVCGVTVKDGYTYEELGNTYDYQTGALTFNTSAKNTEQITWSTKIYSVKIDAKYVDESLLDDYDFCCNTDEPTKRVTLDNVSRNSSGVYFDNTLIKDVKSRAILAKTKDVTIKHCTFRNISMQAIVLGAEETWGEGTTARDVAVEHCLFDNCGMTNEYDKANHTSYDAEPNMSAITIEGVGTGKESIISTVTPHENMLASNIRIRHNKFVNTPNDNLICVTGAANVTINDNVMEERDGDGKVVYVNGCANVEMLGNTYTERVNSVLSGENISDAFALYNSINVNIEGSSFASVTAKP